MALDVVRLLTLATQCRASDLHLRAGMPPMIRVDGDLQRMDRPVLEASELHAALLALAGDAQCKNPEEPLEADFACEIPGLARFRVNAFAQKNGAGAVFRALPETAPTLEALDAPSVLRSLAMEPRGIVLVTGPTGSGKTTTLAALVRFINENRSGHILTIEDPIEFVHESGRCLVTQREVRRDTRDFATALRSALREDPDVILVGEMRDLETVRLALTAAETGHLVLATLHTSSATQTVNRVVDVFPAGEKDMVRSMLSESLCAVIAQTLLKKTGGGRIAAWEVMTATPAVRNLIREDKVAQLYSTLQTGQSTGMQTLDQSLHELLRRELIGREEALHHARHKETLT